MNKREETISLCSLSIGYKQKGGEKCVARDINAKVYSGELTCLLGANGIGKSTLLRTMTANQPMLGGEILYKGNKLSSYSAKMLSSMISIVLTEKIAIKNMSVFELVGLGRSPYTGFWGTLSADDEKKIYEALELVGITKLKNRMIHTLSDGERQKVMIAKALAQQTPIILLDEPTAFLDFPSKVEMMHLLHKLSRQTEKTIFMSTHDLDLALQISDRIWLMDGSRNIHTGIPEDLALDGSLRSFFERKGIVFDQATGLFKVNNEVNSRIKVGGHGHTYSMVRKALMRNGIIVDRELEGAELSIDIQGEQIFVVRENGERTQLDSVESLLNIVVP